MATLTDESKRYIKSLPSGRTEPLSKQIERLKKELESSKINPKASQPRFKAR